MILPVPITCKPRYIAILFNLYAVHANHMKCLVKCRFWFSMSVVGQGFCISNKLSGEDKYAHLGIHFK